jgi:tRNA(fMet)-specific endonuclease VapC
MTYRYLLDTDVVSDLVRNPEAPLALRVGIFSRTEICTSIVVAAELRFGAVRRGSMRLSRQLETVLDALDILPLDEPIDRIYAELRSDLERRGRPIGSNDMLIGAHALALGCALVTGNEREFSRIPGLRIENWLRPPAS